MPSKIYLVLMTLLGILLSADVYSKVTPENTVRLQTPHGYCYYNEETGKRLFPSPIDQERLYRQMRNDLNPLMGAIGFTVGGMFGMCRGVSYTTSNAQTLWIAQIYCGISAIAVVYEGYMAFQQQQLLQRVDKAAMAHSSENMARVTLNPQDDAVLRALNWSMNMEYRCPATLQQAVAEFGNL